MLCLLNRNKLICYHMTESILIVVWHLGTSEGNYQVEIVVVKIVFKCNKNQSQKNRLKYPNQIPTFQNKTVTTIIPRISILIQMEITRTKKIRINLVTNSKLQILISICILPPHTLIKQ